MRPSQLLGVCLFAACLTLASNVAAVDFRWTQPNPLTGEGPYWVDAVSADGRTTTGGMSVGDYSHRTAEAYIAHEGAIRSIGTLPGDTYASGELISRDGHTVFGISSNDQGRSRTFRWTEAEGMIDLGPTRGEALAVSADGSVVVGVIGRDPHVTSGSAFRWTEAEGLQRILDHDGLSAVSSIARDVSDDGHVVVGSFSTRAGFLPFRWMDGNTDVLPDIPGGHEWASAQHVLPDGDIVGVGWNESGAVGVVWTDDGTVEPIPNMTMPDGAPRSFDIASISDDRSVAILMQTSLTYLWTESQGARDAAKVLHDDFGVPPDFYLGYIHLMSADGTRLVGSGSYHQNPVAWQISLVPPPLAADANFDGVVSLSDFGALKDGYGRKDRPFRRFGNFDGDKDVDVDDFGILKATFGDRQPLAQAAPEPSASALLLAGAVSVCLMRLVRPLREASR